MWPQFLHLKLVSNMPHLRPQQIQIMLKSSPHLTVIIELFKKFEKHLFPKDLLIFQKQNLALQILMCPLVYEVWVNFIIEVLKEGSCVIFKIIEMKKHPFPRVLQLRQEFLLKNRFMMISQFTWEVQFLHLDACFYWANHQYCQ